MLTEVTINISVFAHLLQLTKDKKIVLLLYSTMLSGIILHSRSTFYFLVNKKWVEGDDQCAWLIYLNVTIVIAYIHLGETSYPILPVYEKLTYYL